MHNLSGRDLRKVRGNHLRSKGNPGARILCGGYLHCMLSSSLLNLPITGGNPRT